MKAKKVKEAMKAYDQLQGHIDQCDRLIDDLTPKPKRVVCPVDNGLQFGGTFTIHIGGIENALGEYLYFNIGSDIRRLIENKRKELIAEQDALEI